LLGDISFQLERWQNISVEECSAQRIANKFLDALLQELFSKAKNPHRVFVGAVQQLYTDIDEACWRPGKYTLCLFDLMHQVSACAMRSY